MRLETAVDPRLDEIIDRFFADRITRADDMGGRYGDLWRRAADATQGGKRLRPRLLLLAHESLGGVEEDSALRAAAAIADASRACRIPVSRISSASTPIALALRSASASGSGARSCSRGRNASRTAGPSASVPSRASATSAASIRASNPDQITSLFDEK